MYIYLRAAQEAHVGGGDAWSISGKKERFG